jgi:hypothetical protein
MLGNISSMLGGQLEDGAGQLIFDQHIWTDLAHGEAIIANTYAFADLVVSDMWHVDALLR